MDQDLVERIVREVMRRLKAEMGAESLSRASPPLRIVVDADVREALRHGRKEIRILPGAIITPLARDTMREKGVRLEVVPE
jgi:hypothetical protein